MELCGLENEQSHYFTQNKEPRERKAKAKIMRMKQAEWESQCSLIIHSRETKRSPYWKHIISLELFKTLSQFGASFLHPSIPEGRKFSVLVQGDTFQKFSISRGRWNLILYGCAIRTPFRYFNWLDWRRRFRVRFSLNNHEPHPKTF